MEIRQQVSTASRQLAAWGHASGTSSNVSVRNGERIAVTATGVRLATATPEQITVVDPSGNVVEGELAPTSELALHLAVYAGTPAGAVVHTHAPYATALGLVLEEVPVVHYEQLLLGGSLRVAPFAVFGTEALASGVQQALQGRKGALMANHGAVVWGRDLAEALDLMVLLEGVCALYWRARSLGEPRVLGLAEQRGVIEEAMRRRYGSTQKVS